MRDTVSALWVGSRLGPLAGLCLTSFVRSGYDTQLFLFDPQIEVPEGVIRRDARDVLPESTVFENRDRPGTYAGYANLFRYRLLQLEATTWVDVDVLSVGTLPEGEYLFGAESPTLVNNAVLRAPQDSELLRVLFDRASSVPADQVRWGMIGPVLLTAVVEELGMTGCVAPVSVLYPVHYSEVWKLFDPQSTQEVVRRLDTSATLHLWNEVLRHAPIPVASLAPPKGSYMDLAFNQAELAPPTDVVMDPDWARHVWRPILEPKVSIPRRLMSRLSRRLHSGR